MSNTKLVRRPAAGFVHEALLYDGTEDTVAELTAFVRGGFEAGEPTLVALPARTTRAVRDRLGAPRTEVTFVDLETLGRNPARLTALWHDWITSHPGQDVRGVGEPVWPERSRAELAECVAHEQLLNVACDASTLWLLCPYDTAALPAEAVAIAGRTHAYVFSAGAHHTRRRAEAGEGALAAPLEEPTHVILDSDAVGTPAEARHGVAAVARLLGLSHDRLQDLVLAVSEVAGNSVVHGGGVRGLRAWLQDGALVAEVRDGGRITDPLVGRTTPDVEAAGGRGVWIAHQLCDLVQVRSGENGTVVRLHVRL